MILDHLFVRHLIIKTLWPLVEYFTISSLESLSIFVTTEIVRKITYLGQYSTSFSVEVETPVEQEKEVTTP